MAMRRFIIHMFLLVLLVACTPNNSNEPTMEGSDTAPASMNGPVEVKEYFQSEKKINDWHIIQDDKHVLVAVNLKHFQRLKRKSLEKKWTEDLQELFPNKEVVLSSDFKIMYELNKLQHDTANPLSEKTKKKRTTKLIKMLQEET